MSQSRDGCRTNRTGRRPAGWSPGTRTPLRFALHTHALCSAWRFVCMALCSAPMTHGRFPALHGALLCTNDTRALSSSAWRCRALHGAVLCTNDTRALSSSAWRCALHE